ncbi:MAG: Glu/Leu/Phe/Val dehydrogenase family protein, partial [Acidimicrobiales bacterium]
VHNAVRAVAERVWGSSDLRGRHVAISGVGKVGSDLARRLTADGAQLTVADVRADVVGDVAAELDAVVADPATIHALACDVFAPCALGAVLSGATIAELQCAAVCGSANNQLATDADAGRLAARGVLYAPDYVVNSGGVINIADETGPGGYDHDRAFARVATIHDTLLRIFALADEHGETPAAAADRFAEARLARGRAPRSEGAGSAR